MVTINWNTKSAIGVLTIVWEGDAEVREGKKDCIVKDGKVTTSLPDNTKYFAYLIDKDGLKISSGEVSSGVYNFEI